MLRHYLSQGTTLRLQLATNYFLQLQHFSPHRIEQREGSTDLLH
jgi:hypothetical protein